MRFLTLLLAVVVIVLSIGLGGFPLLDPDEGAAEMPRGARIGYIAQEAPTGAATPFETVLAADLERAALLAEEAACKDLHHIGEIHERLNAIHGAHPI